MKHIERRQPMTRWPNSTTNQRGEVPSTTKSDPRSGRPKTATDEGTSTMVLEAMVKSPKKGTRRLSAEIGISQSSVMRKWHPFQMQMFQQLAEYDPDRRVEFCEWALNMNQNVLILLVPSFFQMRQIYCYW